MVFLNAMQLEITLKELSTLKIYNFITYPARSLQYAKAKLNTQNSFEKQQTWVVFECSVF